MRVRLSDLASIAENDANTSIQNWYLNISNNRQVSELWLDGLRSPDALDEDILASITAALLPAKDLVDIFRNAAADLQGVASVATPVD